MWAPPISEWLRVWFLQVILIQKVLLIDSMSSSNRSSAGSIQTLGMLLMMLIFMSSLSALHPRSASWCVVPSSYDYDTTL